MKTLLTMCLLACSMLTDVHAQSDELLPADQAFSFSAVVLSPNRLQVTWEIADGYYMYRSKFDNNVLDSGAVLGTPLMPTGEIKSDEYFGEQEIYTDRLSFEIPVKREALVDSFTMVVESTGQGCNEPVGVCYPPLKQTATLEFAALTENTGSAVKPADLLVASGVNSLESLRNFLTSDQGQAEFLKPDEAFRFDLFAKDPSTLNARVEIAAGYYLYRDKFEFQSETKGVEINPFTFPPGVEKEDEYFGKMITYYDGVDLSLPLKRDNGTSKASFQVTYQGCADQGICYPPITKNVIVDLLPFSDAQATTTSTTLPVPGTGFWGYILGAFVVGLLLTFTPCVLPLVPIMSSFIVGQGGEKSRGQGGLLSFTYVMGTAVTYTAAGIVAGASGEQLQAYFQNIWFIGFVSLMLLVLALSMFGVYELQMPGSIQSRLQQKTQRLGGGKLTMVFVLGMVSALIVGACVSPLLIGALGVAIMKGDPVLGGAIMFSMALGMGVILVLIGVGLSTLLPRVGPWMDHVKHAFGIVLIGTAIYLLGAIHWVPVLYFWSALLMVTAVYFGALQAVPPGASGWRYLWKGLGVFLLVWGVLALLGGMSGNRDILKPVDVSRWSSGATSEGVHRVEFIQVQNLSELDEQLAAARSSNRPVMLDYYADWCVDCIRMEKSTFTDAEVAEVLDNFVLVQVDVTDPEDEARSDVKQRYGVYGPPAMLFFDRMGEERVDMRRYGFMYPAEFLEHIKEF